MNDQELISALTSVLPSDRMEAAQWLVRHPDGRWLRQVVSATHIETVPPIRKLLNQAKEALEQDIRTTSGAEGDDKFLVSGASSILRELGALVRHETEPAIGWVRRAANMEVNQFETSQTNRAIEALRRRIGGLAMLADANRLPQWQTVSIQRLLSDVMLVEGSEIADVTRLKGPQHSDEIYTDTSLMSVILSNALQNAARALDNVVADRRHIFIEWDVYSVGFYLSVTNSFDGVGFTLADVVRPGITSSTGSRGLGVLAMVTASHRLGYEFDLAASAGVVTVSLKGGRLREHD